MKFGDKKKRNSNETEKELMNSQEKIDMIKH